MISCFFFIHPSSSSDLLLLIKVVPWHSPAYLLSSSHTFINHFASSLLFWVTRNFWTFLEQYPEVTKGSGIIITLLGRHDIKDFYIVWVSAFDIFWSNFLLNEKLFKFYNVYNFWKFYTHDFI